MKPNTPKFFLMMTLLLSLTSVHANICKEISLPDHDDYTFSDKIYIKSFDGVRIAANIFEPKIQGAQRKFPAIIFVNSWFLEEHEYFNQAKKLASEGFIVLSYSARGWGCSDGKVNVIGDNDMKDLSKVIDWLERNSDVDVENIGMSGISYGGGMTLKALALEPRIKTGVAMSAWGNLVESLYGNDTLRSYWSAFLLSTGFVTGELDPLLFDLVTDVITKKDISRLLKWANKRSPINYIDKINQRNTPVFIANNLGDNLFQPNQIIDFFEKLTVPKRLELNQGTHATGEGIGLILDANYTFQNLRDWFGFWLKDSRSSQYPNFKKSEVSILTSIEHKREVYRDTSIMSSKRSILELHLKGRTLLQGGKLTSENEHVLDAQDLLLAGLDSLASTGTPLASALINAHLKRPVIRLAPLLSSPYSLNYISQAHSEKLRLRGMPELKLNIKPFADSYQVVAYLYDVGPLGLAKLITHGVYTRDNFIQGDDENKSLLHKKERKAEEIVFKLNALAYDLKKGHRLALTFDSADPLYYPLRPFYEDMQLQFSGSLDNILSIQYIKE